MRMTNWRRLWRLRVLLCYLLLFVISSRLVLYLYGTVQTASWWYKVDKVAPFKSSSSYTHQGHLFVERPLILLTLSYHASPIYDLMDQLKPLGIQFIERGINAYACQYFNTCQHHDPLKVNCYYLDHREDNLQSAWIVCPCVMSVCEQGLI